MVECDIDNQSSVTIDTMVCMFCWGLAPYTGAHFATSLPLPSPLLQRLKLMRFITLRDNHGHQRTITDTVLENM